MKFADMQYTRPELESTQARYRELLKNFKAAKTADECFASHKEINDFTEYVNTMINLAYVRKTLNTKDEYYAAEYEYLDEVRPHFKEVLQEIFAAMLNSPFRKEMEAAWGKIMFSNLEIELKTFSPEIIEDLQEENRLCSEYADLLASAEIEFDGKTLNLSDMSAYFENKDRDMRVQACEALSNWYTSHAEQFDTIFDKLVKLRTGIAKKLGYESFTELGYYRMQRNCFDEAMVTKFRQGIIEHIVPLILKIKAEQAVRIGVDKIDIADLSFNYPDGNPTPKGTPDEIFAHGKKMFAELSDETSEFFNFMLENDLFDVLSKPGKGVGGYLEEFHIYKAPFIFANFNGTSNDIYVLAHEAGHGYASYVAYDIYPYELREGSPEISEIHAMAMEFFAWPWMEGFFGADTQKYYHRHLSKSIEFLPYGSMVDEFQHLVYAKPEMTPAERNALWLELEAKYRPWIDMAGIPYWAEGRCWHRQAAIYEMPFYYIDYCLAGIMALNFWALNQSDHMSTWEKYVRLVKFAATKNFVELVSDSGLPTPFEPQNLKMVADMAAEWLEKNRV
ncbi:MAG: M3 family oligoendopeptidase [Defluviitaleaceae bacterium]|nr:M3 family oligoendopeptidase [Defluviitaleaceae bacterium]